ncbi:hypothetical protein [Bradyrhizobium quebecense]|uniref:Uncharacterized protein n=2 Tax=Bradyrhizobium quebecense TaxID=2748629 RepID=A0ABS3M8S4_9BRAD|nr:hypothetical protein [Bradyrhizobium quebecense]UGY03276.1 hypothetical protein J4P68_0000390 [Bradyrhizobium quebecense]
MSNPNVTTATWNDGFCAEFDGKLMPNSFATDEHSVARWIGDNVVCLNAEHPKKLRKGIRIVPVSVRVEIEE